MAEYQSASSSHLWDPDYSEEGKDFVYNNEGLHDELVDNIPSLSMDLELSDTFWNLLLQRGVVDEMVQHKIKEKRIKRAQANSLVNHVTEGEVYKFHGFIWALVNSHQCQLAEQLGFNLCDYLDMEVFMMSSSFRCPACHEFYTKAYILTGCGHYVCAPCVKGAQFVCKENKKEDVTCPVPECGKITEAYSSARNIGLNEDKAFNVLGEAVVRRITEVKESEFQDAEEVKIDETQTKALQEQIGQLGRKIASLQKHRDILRKHEAGIKEYIQEEARKAHQNVDEWAKGNLGRYLNICQQVEKKLQKSCQWQMAASELSVLMKAKPGFLEGSLKDQVNLPKETLTDAAKKLITKLGAGCGLPLLCTPFPYKTSTPIPPAKAKPFTHWKLPQDQYCYKLAWLSDSLMVLTNKGVWRMDLNIGTAECKQKRIQAASKPLDMSVAADGTWILSQLHDCIIEIHYPGLKEVKRWRPEGVNKSSSVFINNKNIFICEYDSKIIRSYSRELVYVDQYDIGTDDTMGRIHVTESGRLLKNSWSDCKIYTIDMQTKEASSFGRKGEGDGKLYKPCGTCTVNDDDCILVCDYGNNRVSVFTHEGHFIHHLDVEGGIQMPYSVSVPDRREKPSLMAVYGNINGAYTVGVYRLE